MSKIEVNEIDAQCGSTITVGSSGKNVKIEGNDIRSNDYKASDGGSIISQCGTNITLGASGDTINLASGASQTGFGRTGTVDWETTPKTATFTAVSGEGYFCNTTSSAFTVNLPAGSAGAIVSLADYAGTWQTNALTVSPDGTDKIGGVNADAALSTEGQSVTFVYVDSTQGWLNTMDSTSNVRGSVPFLTATGGTITECGNCKIHTFTGPGTFCVSGVSSCASRNQVSYMVIAGGGGGMGGGAGAGGFREDKSPVTPYTASPLEGAGDITVTATAFPITVGGGGGGAKADANCAGSAGSNSVFSTKTAAGGGTGAEWGNDNFPQPQNSGGSGGGGGQRSPGGGGNGSGNTPSVSPPQGNPGGTAPADGGESGSAGGGGGAGGNGGNGSPGNSGSGGSGTSTSISGSSVTRAGGGGGGGRIPGSSAGSGGPGGGGAGTASGPATATSGTTNTGSGGGGGGFGSDYGTGGNGGSGIVIIRYKFQ